MNGKLNIVGIGPGHDEHITPAALAAIREADYVIGYSTYINLVRHHLTGKQVTRTGMTEEIARAQMAVDTAAAGKTVTLISSGDAGVYGMAGLVFEVLRKIGWQRGQSPDVNLVPGITAANSCASLVGAPLIHDSCRISLSDLLTPWPAIENRIDCAARGDFVITLYNPASGRRQRQIVEAARIIKKYRPGTTPVALIKSAYRRQQSVVLSDLDHFLEFEIGMNTTVIVGSTNTFVYQGFMVTPRGYANKYSLQDGSIHAGQQKAVSLRCEGDMASQSVTSDSPKLNITKISNAFMRTTTSESEAFAEAPAPLPRRESQPVIQAPDSSAANALAALKILKQQKEKAQAGSSRDNPSPMGTNAVARMAGAMVYRRGQKYFLVGEIKEPCDFAQFGFVTPELNRKKSVELQVSDPTKLKALNFELLVDFQSADAVYDHFAIYRNSSISERITSLVKDFSQKITVEDHECIDARWLAQTPMPIWTMVREGVLKC